MDSFSLLVKPASADCNLRCPYCFYLGHSALYPQQRVHRMPEPVLERMIASFMAVPMAQHAFGWQGGEPTLMGVEFFRKVTALQQKHGRPGAVVANGLQTNATLITDELAAHLGEFRFLVGVSLDGPAEIHDHYRVGPDGRGSHAAVMAGIERLRRHRVEFNILVLVNDRNVGRAAEVYRWLVDQGFLYHQYIPCVEFDAQGALRPYAVTAEQWGRFLCDLYDCWAPSDTRRVSIRLFDSIVANLVDGSRTVCTMGKDCRQYFVVEWNGDIYPCDFFVQPGLRIGNLMQMDWEQAGRSDIYRRFGQRKARWNEACRGCEHLAHCAGDCLKHRMAGGRGDPRTLSWLCAGWKRFYADALPGLERLAAGIRGERASRVAPGPATPVGRNDPCPCGSGRKYKHCCMPGPGRRTADAGGPQKEAAA